MSRLTGESTVRTQERDGRHLESTVDGQVHLCFGVGDPVRLVGSPNYLRPIAAAHVTSSRRGDGDSVIEGYPVRVPVPGNLIRSRCTRYVYCSPCHVSHTGYGYGYRVPGTSYWYRVPEADTTP